MTTSLRRSSKPPPSRGNHRKVSDGLPALDSDCIDAATLEEVTGLELAARGAVEGARIGRHRSFLSGLSTNFTHHRAYVPGDEIRHVDWRVYSRSERYFVRKYEAETNYEAYLLVDASASMTFAGDKGVSKLDYAKRLAATVAYRIVEDRDSAGLAVFDDELRGVVPPKGSKSLLVDLVRELNKAENAPRTNTGHALAQIAGRMKNRGFVILISDLLTDEEEFVRGIHQLVCAGHNVIVFQVLDHDELTFPYEESTRFTGLESDDELTTEPGRLRQQYLGALGKMIDRYRIELGNVGVDHVLVDTSQPVGSMLASYLSARSQTRV